MRKASGDPEFALPYWSYDDPAQSSLPTAFLPDTDEFEAAGREAVPPLKRRFLKNYIVVRNLVANPRAPLDISLGLMKNLLVQDLKNISANKEVSETIRKLALKMYKQKIDEANKK